MSATLANMRDFIEDILDRRGNVTIGGNPISLIAELHGGAMVELTAFEPDPATCREPYYYNTALNSLYKRVVVEKSAKGDVAFWQRVSLNLG